MKQKGMLLTDVPNKTKIRVLGDIKVAPSSSLEIDIGDELEFIRLDGMYGKCYNKDRKVCYLAGWAQVEIINE